MAASPEICVPATVESPVTLLEWNVREGEQFRAGEALVELVTSEGCLVVSAPAEGLVAEIYVADGCRVDPGEPLARVDWSAS